MAEVRAAALEKRSDALWGRYRFRFAEKPRATRDLAEIDRILAEARALVEEAKALPDGGQALLPVLEERAKHYAMERDAIREARAAGPVQLEAAVLGTRANFLIARYHRHFAGHERRTRDLGLLDELIDEAEGLQRGMARLVARANLDDLRKDLEIVSENLAIYRNEREAVAEAQAAGTPQDRAGLLATLANQQFAIYQARFAGRSRLTRRAGLLERMLGELGRIGGEMEALRAGGLADPGHARNIGIVAERRAAWRAELAAIEQAQAEASAPTRMDALGAEGNRLMAAYDADFAGQDRATRDPEAMSALADELGDVEAELTALATRFDLDPQDGPLGLVRDALHMFEREVNHIREARLN
ncbi:MAG: hypothetical protein H6744_05885 [Deltaproteobacteria bacterium]|nr:hypothetical protein [Deltaproteobacteria bacterium]MCB9786209.1 hypothetical protein [Deltaproteobacteria bacterium]